MKHRISMVALCSVLIGPWSIYALTTADVEGESGAGSNDSPATAQVLGVLPIGTGSLTVNGFISDTIDADIDFYQFTVTGGTVDVYFDIDLANDAESLSDDDAGLDAQLVIFDADGRMIGYSDDSSFFEVPPDNAGTDPGSDPFGDLDPFIAPLPMTNGVYYAAVSAYDNDPIIGFGGSFTILSVSGFSFSGLAPNSGYDLASSIEEDDTVFGTYRLDIRTTFAEIAIVPGDTDGDSDIDDSDLGTAFANYTGPVASGKTAAQGDTDGDGDVDDSDLGTLFANYTGPIALASVPEPASFALLSLGGLALMRRRNR